VGRIKHPSRRRAVPEPAPIEIRQMQLRDLPGVFDLGLQLFTAERFPTLYRCWDEDELVQLFGSDVETCLVAESGERLTGFALGHLMNKPRSAWRYGWLMWLGVARGYKRSGVASRLVNHLTRLFIERGARIMLVDTDESNDAALAFFRRQGFGQEIRHVFMSLNLENHPKYIAKHEQAEEVWED
jgi:ribosomal protein S18 acetylase RimI-like enzyme